MIKTIETKEEFAAVTEGKLYTTDRDSFYISDTGSEEKTTFYRVAVYDAKTKKTDFYKVRHATIGIKTNPKVCGAFIRAAKLSELFKDVEDWRLIEKTFNYREGWAEHQV